MNKLIPFLAFSILLLVPAGAQNAFAGSPTATLSFEIPTSSVDEGTPTQFINVVLTTGGATLTEPVTVTVMEVTSAATPNAATAGLDYFTVHTTLLFPSGSTDGIQQAFLPIIDDNLVEGPENVDFMLTNLQGPAEILNPNLHRITIVDNDVQNQPVGGELIPIESTSLVLVGTHLTAAWLIPVIVSAVGIGLVFLRKQDRF